jgi:divalent metal cation (Fe/Co/Zn/Cd) transporter
VTENAQRSPRFYAALSIAAAVVTIALKMAAWRLTGSVGLLSDAFESVVNLAAALIANPHRWIEYGPGGRTV